MFEVVIKHLKVLIGAYLWQLPVCRGVDVHYMHCVLFCMHLLLEVYKQL